MPRHFTRLIREALRRLSPGQKLHEHGIKAECLSDGPIHYL
jgi:hypothetical protein